MSSENSSLTIAGDAKQSIYRWRGSQVEQFIELINENNPFYIDKELINLPVNYRSNRKIIEFNNLFFQNLKNKLSINLSKIYDGCAQNSDYAKDGGYVHIELIDDQNEGFKENMQRIAAAHPDSPMSDRWGGSSRTHKEIKTKSAIDKHAKKVAKDGWSSNKILTGSGGSSRRKNK